MSADSQSRLVKIVGFEMKVLVALVTDYVDWLGDSIGVICQLTVSIQRSVNSPMPLSAIVVFLIACLHCRHRQD